MATGSTNRNSPSESKRKYDVQRWNPSIYEGHVDIRKL